MERKYMNNAHDENKEGFENDERFENLIASVADFPRPGIIFRDITPLLCDWDLFREVVICMSKHMDDFQPHKVVGIESRGFILGSALALDAAAGFVPVRKAGKLPRERHSVSCSLEYGEETLEMHKDAIKPGEVVIIVDDVLATGGTTEAAIKLVEMCGGVVAMCVFLAEITQLKGRERIKKGRVESIVKF